MDGFVSRGQVIVIGATNIPEVLDPALRRPGTLRSRDRDRRAEHPGAAADPQDSHARDAARPRRRPGGDRRAFPRLRRRRSRSAVPGSRHDRPAPVPLTTRLTPARATTDTPTDESADLASAAGHARRLPRRIEGGRAERDARVLHREEPLDVCVARRARRGEAPARRGGRACAHARRDLRAGRAGAAARHPARRTVGNRQDGDGPGALRAKNRFRSSPSTAHSSTRNGSANPRKRCARSSRRRGGPRPVCCFSTPSTRSRLDWARDHFGADVYQRILEPAAARDRQPARRERRDSAGGHEPSRTRRTGALAKRAVRLYRSVCKTGCRRPGRDRPALLPPGAAGAGRRHRGAGRRAEGFTGADVESLCKKATLLAIADFQNRARSGSFVVHQRDFLTILENGPSIETTS